MRRRGRQAMVAAAVAATALLVLIALASSSLSLSRTNLLGSGRMMLAYDGMYDTPPVTWYFPGSQQENTLGYTWNNVEYQTPTTTYTPGIVTQDGIAMTTADTIGFLTGPTSTAYPFGTNVEYQSYKSKARSMLAEQRDDFGRFEQLSDAALAKEFRNIRAGHKDDFTRKLDKYFDRHRQTFASTGASNKQERKSKDSNTGGLEKLLSPASWDAPSSPSKKKNTRKQSLMKIDPFEYDVHSPEKADNVLGNGYVNVAPSGSSSNQFVFQNDVQYQSPAVGANTQLNAYPAYPTPAYSFHVNHGGWLPNVDGEIWAYSGKKGPNHWGDIKGSYGVCANGQNQSPINFELNVLRDDNLKMLRWVGPTDPYEVTLISPLYKNVITVEGLQGTMVVNDEEVELKYAQIHTPSEHRLQGRQTAGEIQFYHTSKGSSDVKVVVSAFLEVGPYTASSLQTIMDGVGGFEGTYNLDANGLAGSYVYPRYGQDVKPSIWFDTAKMAEDVLGAGSNYANYYTYYGSLTAPPCTEGVTWIVLKTPVLISPNHHADLLYEQGYTARPTQRLYDREVYDTATGRSLGFQSPSGW
ncbi:hypothetical protein GUITHDRAFT_138994 [Guillardia theta CCMP2712]|uniref:carbonic anhydrase n=1 Tax=Guillardia theta (strain CCMP2712) TaxID=905079 RepID=L1JA74_GUITC|nr:hypothetical protein GUITHDRAFT_138994 [Guillardia theta CCMP2712]EKX45421.1 hypothetical protein GUITHDRAFT_138994 [Guillardia theta CCMP2712]|eukprot:XP_005832401.1 hypothetical protein GUITHDRAFT_138994 [Guillardia theta CCMP2712]